MIMPVVRVSEIYDLHTVKGKIGLIGVHTPSRESIDRKWHGYLLNHKHFRILDCSVSLVCASALPLDPLSIGTDPVTQVAPQDIMNPILYRAVSNDAWNTVVSRLYATNTGADGQVNTNSLKAMQDAFPTPESAPQVDQEKLYYSLLASDEWRKAMPMQGLNMDGLRPFCYPVVSNFGQGTVSIQAATATQSTGIVSSPGVGTTDPAVPAVVPGQALSLGSSNAAVDAVRFYRGPAMPLPRMPTCPYGIEMRGTTDGALLPFIAGDSSRLELGRFYVCCILMPPCYQTLMYYRLRISWNLSFDNPCSMLENKVAYYGAQDADYYYKRSYSFSNASKLSDFDTSAVDDDTAIDSVGFEPKLIMEK